MKSKKLIFIATLGLAIGGGTTAAIVSDGGYSDPVTTNVYETHSLTSLIQDQIVLPVQPALSETPGESAAFTSIPQNNGQSLPPFMVRALDWLVNAQHPNGGYGAGTHNRQGIRDPHAVGTDPATSALVGMAFIRAGNTLTSGPYAKQVAGVHAYLLDHIEGAVNNSQKGGIDQGPRRLSINSFNGNGQTQPQRKLGQYIDATFASQFLTRVLEFVEDGSELKERTISSIAACIKSIQEKQSDDGSMSGGTWAGVLQSSMANSAIEQAKGSGMDVDDAKLKKSRDYQRGNVDVKSGSALGSASAGISLYTYSSTSRATAANTRNARIAMERAQKEGTLGLEETVTVANLIKAGVDAEEAEEWEADFRANEVSAQQLQRDDVLSGFGNNGGEEFISYMMTSEGLVISGGDAWDDWNKKMYARLSKIQNNDGSWSGHHCITSPVFCTAAVIMTLATDRDVQYIASTVK